MGSILVPYPSLCRPPFHQDVAPSLASSRSRKLQRTSSSSSPTSSSWAQRKESVATGRVCPLGIQLRFALGKVNWETVSADSLHLSSVPVPPAAEKRHSDSTLAGGQDRCQMAIAHRDGHLAVLVAQDCKGSASGFRWRRRSSLRYD